MTTDTTPPNEMSVLKQKILKVQQRLEDIKDEAMSVQLELDFLVVRLLELEDKNQMKFNILEEVN